MTRISDLLSAGPTLSFEFFPPKTDAGVTSLHDAVDTLAGLEPSFVSVTYGGGGSTRDRTRELVGEMNDRQPFPAMPHLTCVGQSRAELRELLETYRAAGIDNVLALAGDPPLDGAPAGGDFTYGTELIELIRSVGDFSIGVAAFPEVHPRSDDRAEDRRWLAHKLSMADYAITQFFWEVEHYLRLREELDALGCDRPLIPGVMPFANVAGARRMSKVNETHIPDELDRRLTDVDGDPVATRALGVEVAAEQCERLRAEGVPGLHLYALNRADSILAIHEAVGLRPSPRT
jgi:methylenetetrahydrofolate reductase (NADPH)